MIATLNNRLIVLFAFLIGPLGVLAPKGIAVLVVVTGLAGLVGWLGKESPRPSFKLSILTILSALALWAAASAAWAIIPANALLLVLRLVFVVVSGAGLMFAISRLDLNFHRHAENALLVGWVVGLSIMAVGFVCAMKTGDSLWGTYYFDPLTTLNNGAVALSLIAWPALAVAWRRSRKWAAAGVVMAYFGFIFLSSGTALLAPAVGLVGFFIVWFLGRRGAVAVGAIAAILVLASPQLVNSFLSVDSVGNIAAKFPPSARHRLKMWAFAVEKINEKPLLGWGMDASRSIPQEDRRLAPNMEIMPLHPHNAFLQTRLELGIPGAVIVAALVGYFFIVVAGGGKNRFCCGIMTAAGLSYLTVASLSYGVWQNWWVAFAWALAALTGLALRNYSSPTPEG
ncbi:MAG: O-antigen ligase family protein [Rhodospirillales bacterium]|nr:O-antigen ligase family protein [Rhodospirillales bacterium]